MPLLVSHAHMAIRCGMKPKTYTCVECGQIYHCFRSPDKDTIALLAPCPACGRYQPSMVAAVRTNRTNWVLAIGVIVFLIWLVAFCFIVLPALLGPRDEKVESQLPRMLITTSILLSVALGLIWWGWIRHRQMDPNSAPQQERIAQGKRVSLTADAYRQAEANANDSAYSPPQSEGPLIDELAGSSQRWNVRAIFFAFLGVVLTVCGVWSLIDPSAEKLYLGALIVGPIIFLRSLTRIRE